MESGTHYNYSKNCFLLGFLELSCNNSLKTNKSFPKNFFRNHYHNFLRVVDENHVENQTEQRKKQNKTNQFSTKKED